MDSPRIEAHDVERDATSNNPITVADAAVPAKSLGMIWSVPPPQSIDTLPDLDPADPVLDGDVDHELDPDEEADLEGIELIREILPDAVLLKIARGEKRPLEHRWQDLSQAHMTPGYISELAAGHNIGVLLGAASNHICSIDIDDDTFVEPFLELNAALRKTTQSRRVRGCNFWVKVRGEYPKLTKIKTTDGRNWGEWRSTGGQTIIHGEVMDRSKGETEPTSYQILNPVKPIEIAFEDIVWPEGLILPWRSATAGTASRSISSSLKADVTGKSLKDDFIILPGGHTTFSACADDLFQKIAPTHRLFCRGGIMVEVVNRGDGLLGLEVIKPAAFRSRIEDFGTVMVWRIGANGEHVLKPTICPEETAKGLMESLAAREFLPPISTVINSPVMVEADDELHILPRGYHPENGGILVTNGEAPPEIPVEEAAEALKEIHADFDFQSEADRSRALAHLLTPGLKLGGFIKGFVPADVAEADQSQSGKTFRQRLTCAIYGEQPRVVARRDGGVGSMDESFAQALITGCPFVQFDNLRGKFDSQFVESFMTAKGSFPARVPHRGEILVDPSRVFLLLTSNGVDTTRDMANRSCIVRIRKRIGHVFRVFPEGDVFDHVAARQSYYLGCVFSVIRHWVECGKPRTSETGHDFREWAQVLDWIVQNIFGAAPLLEGHQPAQQRISDPALGFLRAVALEVRTAQRMDETLTTSALVDLCEEAGVEIPGLKSAASGDASRRVGVLMKRAFLRGDTVTVDEFTVTRSTYLQDRAGGTGGGAYSTKAYRFQQ